GVHSLAGKLPPLLCQRPRKAFVQTSVPMETLTLTPAIAHGDRVGGGVTAPVLSHHRAYGSVPRRFKVGSEASRLYPLTTPVPTSRSTDSARPPSGVRHRYSTTALDHCSRCDTLALPITPASSTHAL